jgi:hypothetical protein
VLKAWEDMCGTFVRANSGQYGNGVLMLKYLDGARTLFEFRLMEGSESEGQTRELVLPFVCLIDDSGIGQYESGAEAKHPLQISLALSEDGKKVTDTHTGEAAISPDGVYEYTEDGVEISENSAAALPYPFAYSTEQLKSSNPDVAHTNDEDGTITALKPGTAAITGVLRLDDGRKAFSAAITVFASWWGNYQSKNGKQLGIANFNGSSFHFSFDGGDDGVAAVDPDDPTTAEYAQYQFMFDGDDKITVTGGDDAGEYFRA